MGVTTTPSNQVWGGHRSQEATPHNGQTGANGCGAPSRWAGGGGGGGLAVGGHAVPTLLLLQLLQPLQRGPQGQVPLVAGPEQPQQVAGAGAAARVVHQRAGRRLPVRPDLKPLPLSEEETRRSQGDQGTGACVLTVRGDPDLGSGHRFRLRI